MGHQGLPHHDASEHVGHQGLPHHDASEHVGHQGLPHHDASEHVGHQGLPHHDAPEPASVKQAHLQMPQQARVPHTPFPATVTSALQDKCRSSAATATLDTAALPSKPTALGATCSTSAQAQGVAAVPAAPAHGSAAAQQILPAAMAAPVAVMAAVHDPCATSPAAAVGHDAARAAVCRHGATVAVRQSAATAAAGVSRADVPAAASVIHADGQQTPEPAQPMFASVAVQPAQVQQHSAASEAGRAHVLRSSSARSRLARVSAVQQQQEHWQYQPGQQQREQQHKQQQSKCDKQQQHEQQQLSLHRQQHTGPWQAKKRQRSEDLHLEGGGQAKREFEEPHGKRQCFQPDQAAQNVDDTQQGSFQSGCLNSTYQHTVSCACASSRDNALHSNLLSGVANACLHI